MYLCEGNNEYINNEFKWFYWAAPFLQSPAELYDQFHKLDIVGKRVIGFSPISYVYWMDRMWTEDKAYRYYSDLPKEKRDAKSDFEHIDPNLPLDRMIVTDGPLQILFEDGDVLTADWICTCEARLGVNDVPWGISDTKNKEKVNASVLFAPLIGHSIKDIEIHKTDSVGMFDPHGEDWKNQKEFIGAFTLWFSNDLGLLFETTTVDYTEIACVNKDYECLTLPFSSYCKCMTEEDKEKEEAYE